MFFVLDYFPFYNQCCPYTSIISYVWLAVRKPRFQSPFEENLQLQGINIREEVSLSTYHPSINFFTDEFPKESGAVYFIIETIYILTLELIFGFQKPVGNMNLWDQLKMRRKKIIILLLHYIFFEYRLHRLWTAKLRSLARQSTPNGLKLPSYMIWSLWFL